MAVSRTTTYGIGGYDTEKPYNNLMEISYFDDETGETTVYVPPDIPDPLPPTTAEENPEEIEPTLAELKADITEIKKALAALTKEHRGRQEDSHGKEKGR